MAHVGRAAPDSTVIERRILGESVKAWKARLREEAVAEVRAGLLAGIRAEMLAEVRVCHGQGTCPRCRVGSFGAIRKRKSSTAVILAKA